MITHGQLAGVSTTITGSGPVSLYGETTLIGTEYVQANGTMVFGKPVFAVGTHSFTAVYLGDGNYLSVTSVVGSLVVS